jgi:acyl-ACP thioesterase
MPTHDLPPFPATGRVFSGTAQGGLSDAAPGGRVRLDAIARWLQDIAYADVVESGLAERAAWVVRRARLRVARFPRMGVPVTLRTACSGVGRMWAERRTTVVADGQALVEAVSLWVHLDPRSGRPFPLSDAELAVYEPSTGGRRIKGRLRHPAPPPDAEGRPWWFRAADLDVAGHVNNAVAWTVLEEELLDGPEPEAIDAEAEYRAPAQPGRHEVVRADGCTWVVGPDGDIHVSLVHTR